MTTRTALTIYLATDPRDVIPPAPILVDEHYFVRTGLDRPGARLIGFSPYATLPITVWSHEALRTPEKARGLQPNFIVAGNVWRHPRTVADVTVRHAGDVVQVVITKTSTGARYRPYLGDDPDVAERIASAWGSNPGYTATVQPIRHAS